MKYQTLATMENNKEQTHYYILPGNRIAQNMKQGCDMMNLGPQGFRALVRKGVIKKINTSKTEWYENESDNNS